MLPQWKKKVASMWQRLRECAAWILRACLRCWAGVFLPNAVRDKGLPNIKGRPDKFMQHTHEACLTCIRPFLHWGSRKLGHFKKLRVDLNLEIHMVFYGLLSALPNTLSVLSSPLSFSFLVLQNLYSALSSLGVPLFSCLPLFLCV